MVRAVPVSAQALRRRRLSGATVPGGFATRLPPRPGGDRQAIRSGQGLRRLAETLDCRTHHSLAEPLPSAGQGLGVPQPQGARLPALGFHSPDAPKALSLNKMIPDRHLDCVIAFSPLMGCTMMSRSPWNRIVGTSLREELLHAG